MKELHNVTALNSRVSWFGHCLYQKKCESEEELAGYCFVEDSLVPCFCQENEDNSDSTPEDEG